MNNLTNIFSINGKKLAVRTFLAKQSVRTTIDCFERKTDDDLVKQFGFAGYMYVKTVYAFIDDKIKTVEDLMREMRSVAGNNDVLNVAVNLIETGEAAITGAFRKCVSNDMVVLFAFCCAVYFFIHFGDNPSTVVSMATNVNELVTEMVVNIVCSYYGSSIIP